MTKACTTANTPGNTNTSCTLSPEGGTVTYTVNMINDKSNFGSVVIDQICDSAYGQIYPTTGSCKAGTNGTIISGSSTCSGFTIAFGDTASCTFQANQPESTTVTNFVSVAGHGSAAGTFADDSKTVTVVSNEAPSLATVTKGVVATVAACATVRYSVDVANTSAVGTDETETLSALNDSAFGDITNVQGHVLATTCVIPAGGASLPVGGPDYTCTFDAQFCSGLDTDGCIQNTDKVTGTITGDEAGDVVSQTGNTLTVKECLTKTVTSTTP